MFAWLREYWVLCAALTAVIGYGAGLYLFDRRKQAANKAGGPQKSLFAELAGIHGLGGREQQLLTSMAESLQMSEAAELFIDPAHLQQAAGSDSDDAPAYAMLAKKLFGDLAA